MAPCYRRATWKWQHCRLTLRTPDGEVTQWWREDLLQAVRLLSWAPDPHLDQRPLWGREPLPVTKGGHYPGGTEQGARPPRPLWASRTLPAALATPSRSGTPEPLSQSQPAEGKRACGSAVKAGKTHTPVHTQERGLCT